MEDVIQMKCNEESVVEDKFSLQICQVGEEIVDSSSLLHIRVGYFSFVHFENK